MPNHSDSTLLASLRQSIEALALEVALRDLSSPERIQPLVPMLAQSRRPAEYPGSAAGASPPHSAPALPGRSRPHAPPPPRAGAGGAARLAQPGSGTGRRLHHG